MPAEVASRTVPWSIPIARAVPLLVLGALVTFSADHTSEFGLLSFGGFAVVYGVVLGVVTIRVAGRGLRSAYLAIAVVSVLAGAAALGAYRGDVPVLVFVVSAWAVLTGGLEIYAAVRGRGRVQGSRDGFFAGGATLALAVVLLLLPPGYTEHYRGIETDDTGKLVAGTLTAAIVAVGVIGAYAALLGVYLVIGGITLRWAARPGGAGAAMRGDRAAADRLAAGSGAARDEARR